MIENYDVLITGKAWDSIDVGQVFTSKLREGVMSKSPLRKENENEKANNENDKGVIESNIEKQENQEKEKTPAEDDICVICFDKKIQLILNNCLVSMNFIHFNSWFLARILRGLLPKMVLYFTLLPFAELVY